MIGQTISHFNILEKLGEGGMGVVYKAEDTKLKRIVAVKFLPRGIEAQEPERARFLQEAQAASALNHPNVCTIYEISEHEGPAYSGAPAARQQFIVMEFVDGRTLRQMIPVQKIQAAIDYAIQIGEALQEAHSKGIVHRDVKAENIMVNEKKQVKVMDFGLAKLKGSLKLTKTSSTVGTLAYMAPEQIQGGEVDARSDIFSFGVVLYEMLTGHMPFRGEHEAAMVYSIVNEEPIPIQKHLPEVSSELVHVLNRALEKDPEDRYQFVHEMVIDLRRLKKETTRVVRPSEPSEGYKRWILAGGALVALTIIAWLIFRPGEQASAPGAMAKEKSIAVMYFENKTDEKDLDKILVDMLITNLGRNKEISIVSGQRLFDILKALGKQDAASIDKSTATEVAKRAGVKTMLLGTIWKIGGKLSVPAQLLEVESGAVVNSDRVEAAAKPEEVFNLADRLTEKVNEWLKASSPEPLHVSEAMTGSYDAYKFYERGMRSLYRFEFEDATAYFQQAIKVDSTFAMAHLRLGSALTALNIFNLIPSSALERGRVSLARAKQYAKNLPEKDKKFIDAWNAFANRDLKTADVLITELAAGYPQEKEFAYWRNLMSWPSLDLDEMIRGLERSIELDRSYTDAYNQLGYAYALAHNFEKAFAAIRTYIALIPDALNPYDSACEVYEMAGQPYEALKFCEEGLKRVPTWYGSYNRQAYVYLGLGDAEKAREKLHLRATLDSTYLGSLNRGISLTLLFEGRVKEALALLRQDVQSQRSGNNKGGELLSRFYLARVLLEQNHLEEALEEFKKVRILSEETRKGSFNPWPFIVEYYSGLCHLGKGDLAEAEARASAIQLLTKRYQEPYYSLLYDGLTTNIYLAQGKTKEALASMEKILPWTRAAFPRFRILHAAIQTKLHNKTKALGLYDETYSFILARNTITGGDPLDFYLERSKLDYYKGQMYEEFNESVEAINFYEKAISNWRNADKDYVNLVDAKARLAKLRGGK